MKHFLAFAAATLFSVCAFSSPLDPAPPLKSSALCGLWLLNGKVRAVQFNLKPNGTFEYHGYGSESNGKWNVEGSQIRFRWSQIDSMNVDGQKVTALNSFDSGALRVGKFEYRKSTLVLSPIPARSTSRPFRG
jgi:hypothetical protein